jgi:hypothetical protein
MEWDYKNDFIHIIGRIMLENVDEDGFEMRIKSISVESNAIWLTMFSVEIP